MSGVVFTGIGALIALLSWLAGRGLQSGSSVQIPLGAISVIILFYFGLLPLFLGGVLQVVAWIWEGFLLPQGSKEPTQLH